MQHSWTEINKNYYECKKCNIQKTREYDYKNKRYIITYYTDNDKTSIRPECIKQQQSLKL